jgi:7-cyano-7-deazaguanine synthase
MLAMPAAVVLLSGGLDSYTAAAVAQREGFDLYALSVRYGQRHVQELDAARRVAGALGVRRHLEIEVGLSRMGGSALTGETPVPKDHPIDPAAIPVTYVPARNTVFLSLALGWAEVVGASDLVIGVNALDYSGYPDCRPAFIRAFEVLASVGTRAGVEGQAFTVHAPLIDLSKADIVRLGVSLGLDYGLTHSCYDPLPDGRPCRHCDSCRLRAEGFRAAGVADPLVFDS